MYNHNAGDRKYPVYERAVNRQTETIACGIGESESTHCSEYGYGLNRFADELQQKSISYCTETGISYCKSKTDESWSKQGEKVDACLDRRPSIPLESSVGNKSGSNGKGKRLPLKKERERSES
ncbi:hypothetical protein J6590_078836 [Homalodisca vitripennis]|nr:hypothetical protein J6590_078836 [Homalodisca vitripennis]